MQRNAISVQHNIKVTKINVISSILTFNGISNVKNNMYATYL